MENLFSSDFINKITKSFEHIQCIGGAIVSNSHIILFTGSISLFSGSLISYSFLKKHVPVDISAACISSLAYLLKQYYYKQTWTYYELPIALVSGYFFSILTIVASKLNVDQQDDSYKKSATKRHARTKIPKHHRCDLIVLKRTNVKMETRCLSKHYFILAKITKRMRNDCLNLHTASLRNFTFYEKKGQKCVYFL
jgi:hypothetical protein